MNDNTALKQSRNDPVFRYVYPPGARRELQKITEMGFGNLPVCMAKNQYSLSDDPKRLGSFSLS